MSGDILIVGIDTSFFLGEMREAVRITRGTRAGSVLVHFKCGEQNIIKPIPEESFWQYVGNAKADSANAGVRRLGLAAATDADASNTDGGFPACAYLICDSEGNVKACDMNGFEIWIAGGVQFQSTIDGSGGSRRGD